MLKEDSMLKEDTMQKDVKKDVKKEDVKKEDVKKEEEDAIQTKKAARAVGSGYVRTKNSL